MEIIIICVLLYLGFSNRPDKKERKMKPRKKPGFWASFFNSRAKYYKKRDKYWNGGGWYKDYYR
jgi:hypothetical protein